jgi:hypothetical protein
MVIKMIEKFEEILKNTKNSTDHLKKTLKVKRILKKAEDEFAGLLYELGCEIYEEHLNNTHDKKVIDEQFELISVKHTFIKSLKNELNVLNGHVECDACGKLTSNDYDFCPFCGVKLSKNNYASQGNETDNITPEE